MYHYLRPFCCGDDSRDALSWSPLQLIIFCICNDIFQILSCLIEFQFLIFITLYPPHSKLFSPVCVLMSLTVRLLPPVFVIGYYQSCQDLL